MNTFYKNYFPQWAWTTVVNVISNQRPTTFVATSEQMQKWS